MRFIAAVGLAAFAGAIGADAGLTLGQHTLITGASIFAGWLIR